MGSYRECFFQIYSLNKSICMKTCVTQPRNQLLTSFFQAIPVLLTLLLIAFQSNAQTLPTGFNQVLVANGISSPTVFEFAPDGRIFVAKQNGELRIIDNGALLPTPFLSLSVNSSGERGLLGIAFDPNFATNNFLYLYYTPTGAANNRISRFTANGNTAVAGSESVVLNLDPLSSATNHNGGTMQFGPDGKLYVGVGDNANSANAQNLNTYHGKILRINSDGSVPAGNPFTGGAQRSRVWSYGLRNPYTLAIQPGTGRIFVNDVGQNSWEEINDCTVGGGNYGWPATEGATNNPAYVSPVYAYGHASVTGQGCAITGGTFFNPTATNYPSDYIGDYLFFDFCGSWMDRLNYSGATFTRENFGTNLAGSRVALETGPDGNLYFLSRSNAGLYRITYTAASSPVITQQPQDQSVAAGNPASFSVTATGTGLTYQWRKGVNNISGATSPGYSIASTVPADAGTYSVIVGNSGGSETSSNAILTVTSPNQPPVATITTPVVNATYGGGQTIQFSGMATDPEQGNLSASAYQWYVVFHHAAHDHPGPSVTGNGSSGLFTVPTSGETATDVFYRLYLVVTDNQGTRDTAFTDIQPRTSTIIINTNPQGLQITLDGQPFISPYTVNSVEGIQRAIGTSSPQLLGATSYQFSNWSNGGTIIQTVSTPVADVGYTATFTPTPAGAINLSPVADAHVQSGSAAGTNFGASTVLVSKATNDNQWRREIYLKFDISTVPSVSSAKLRVFGSLLNTQNLSAVAQVFPVTNTAWLENTINWNNKPDGGATALSSVTVNGTIDQYYEWDVASAVQAAKAAGASFVSLKIINSTLTPANYTDFNSKEAAANKPVLIIRPAGSVVTLNPVADAYVQAGSSSNSNFGTAATLIVKKTVDNNYRRETFIRFDISALPANVPSSKLRIYGSLLNNSNATGGINLHGVASQAWGETTITFNNKPVALAEIIGTKTITGASDQYYEIDVTAYVSSAKSGGATAVTFQIVGTTEFGNNYTDFNSREAATNKPQLVVGGSPAARLAGESEQELVAGQSPELLQMRVFPNPATDVLYIDMQGFSGELNVTVFDLSGKLLMSRKIYADDLFILPVSELRPGFYFIRSDWEGGSKTERIVIQ